ncbi:MAG: hypothetical protein WC147_09465 [Syntrophomonas sp.]|jgi:hypothetical protein
MSKNEILVSIVTPKPKPCVARIEYAEVSKQIRDIVSVIWPDEPQPFSMPYLVCEEIKSGDSAEFEKLYPLAIKYLMGQALFAKVSLADFSESLVVFCEGFGRLFAESRISVLEARQRVGWQWWFLIILESSIKKEAANKGYRALLRQNVYDPYMKALSNYPDHEGPFLIDFVVFNENDDKAQFLAHPAKKDSEGFILPSKNRGPKTNYNDEVMLWCQSVALMNLNRFLKKNIRYVTKYDIIHGLTLNLKLKDQYTAATLQFLEGKIDWLNPSNVAVLKDKRENDYEASLAKKNRRDVLARFRNWKNRPTAKKKITEPEYNELVKYSKDLLSQHLNKEQMEEELKLHLQETRKKKSGNRKKTKYNK